MQRVVVADDNPAMTAALKVVLQIWGWDVLVAHDGMTAVEAIRASRPALALIDIGLPDLDGLEVARVLRAQGAAPRLMIALSGYGEETDLLASRQAGFDRHLVKPVDPELLRRTIMPVASRAAARASIRRGPERARKSITYSARAVRRLLDWCAQTWFHPARDDARCGRQRLRRRTRSASARRRYVSAPCARHGRRRQGGWPPQSRTRSARPSRWR